MKSILSNRRWLVAAAWAAALVLPKSATAFPPAPHHLFFGVVRDEYGNPLNTDQAEVILETEANVQVKTKVVPGLEAGVNYRLAVPMDAGITSDLYKPTALRPTVPFKFKVRIGAAVYLPIEMVADYSRMGRPGEKTRVNLTLGEDSDGDGLPDAWERALVVQSGGTKTFKDIRPGDDGDGDGLSNLQEYLAGTYAFDDKDGFSLKALRAESSGTELEFLAIRGRTYSIHGSADMQTWSPVPFRLSSDSPTSPPRQVYSASDVSIVRARVTTPADGTPARFFKLMVE